MATVSKAQEWASKRNSTKWRMSGLAAVMGNLIMHSPLTQGEAAHLDEALDIVDNILLCWKRNNKESKKAFMELSK